MATPSVTPNLTVISAADSITNWVGDTFSVDNEIFIQNGASVSCALTNNGINDVWVSGSWNLTAGEHLRIWVNILFIANLATEANNGIQVWISDGSNTAYWTVSGQDTYSGGWQNFVVYTGSAPTSGTVPTGNTTQIGFRANTVSKPRNQPANIFFDYWTFGDGVFVAGGSAGDPITLAGIAAADKTAGYGVVNGIEGSYFLTGSIVFGQNNLGSNINTYLEDNGSVITFTDRNVSSTLYNISTDTNFGLDFLPTTVSLKFANTVIKSSNPAQEYSITIQLNPANGTSLIDFNGCFISNASNILFTGDVSATTTTFNNCKEINPSSSVFTDCSITNSSDTVSSMYLAATNFVTNPTFLTYGTPTAAIRIDTAGTYPFSGYTFDGSGVAVRNESTGTVDINATGSAGLATNSFINTNGGTTNINNLVTFRVTNVREDSEVRIISTDATPVELGGVENVSGTPTGLNGVTVDADPDNAGRFRVNYSYSYGGSDTAVLAVIHHVDYQFVRTQTLLRATESSLQISQVGDRQYDRGTTFIPA